MKYGGESAAKQAICGLRGRRDSLTHDGKKYLRLCGRPAKLSRMTTQGVSTRRARRMMMGSLVGALILMLAIETQAAGWERVINEEGIIVLQKKVEGRTMPVFRAIVTVTASPTEVLAVIDDYENQCDWMPKCEEIRLIEQIAPNDRYIYSRANAPWPVQDRDVVIRSRFDIVQPDHDVKVTFRATRHPRAPSVDGVVRIQHTRSHYRLRRVGPDKTRVEYEVDSDPGGTIPDWLVARESRTIPLETLRNLRDRVRKTRGSYVGFVQRWRETSP